MSPQKVDVSFITNNKAQITIIALFLLVVTLITFAALLPTIKAQIDSVSPELDSASATLIGLVPMAFVIVILTSIFIYSQPRYG